jgi:hypothetical protein
MKISFKKKSTWQQAIDPVKSLLKGKTLTVNGKVLSAESAAKPAARAVGGLLIATVASAFVSSIRGKATS